MLIAIDPNDPRSLYVQIVDEVRRAVVLGHLRPDDPLPSVRQLAVELRVNPNTVSQAYRELERQGVVQVRRGQGTFVRDNDLDGAERSKLAAAVAARAVRDARRNGLTTKELIDAIRKADTNTRRQESP